MLVPASNLRHEWSKYIFSICLKPSSFSILTHCKDFDAGRDWGQEEKGTTEDVTAGWHHWLDGHVSEWTLGDGDGQGGLACCDSWGRKESDTTERLNWTELRLVIAFLPRSKCLLILWLQSPSAVILEPKKIKSVTVSIVFPSICHEVIGLDAKTSFFECWVLSQLFHAHLSFSSRGSIVPLHFLP